MSRRIIHLLNKLASSFIEKDKCKECRSLTLNYFKMDSIYSTYVLKYLI